MKFNGLLKDLSLFEKFVKLCAGRVGQILNLKSLASDVGISHTTARSWISILEAGFIVFLLPPWFRNISKRLIKSPKLYFYDVGLAGYLLGLENEHHISRDPLRGHLFKNIAVIEAMKYRFNRGLRSNLSFYRDSGGNEVDLILEIGPGIFPLEIKTMKQAGKIYIKQQGFTMIEIVMVLVVLAIVATVVAYRPATFSSEIIAQADILKSHLRYAQIKAMNDIVPWGIHIPDANSYILYKNNAPADDILPGETAQTHTLPAAVTITSGAGSTYNFDDLGSPGTSTLTIMLSQGTTTSNITITKNTGYIP